MKMGFLESARRGGSEKSSIAMYLVRKILPCSMLKKDFGALGGGYRIGIAGGDIDLDLQSAAVGAVAVRLRPFAVRGLP